MVADFTIKELEPSTPESKKLTHVGGVKILVLQGSREKNYRLKFKFRSIMTPAYRIDCVLIFGT